MKRLLFLSLAVILFSACNKKSITINAVIDPGLELNKSEVQLVIYNGEEETEYFTEVANDSFHFKKSFQYDHLSVLQIDGLGNFVICVEGGVLDINIKQINTVDGDIAGFVQMSGTPNNNIINKYNEYEHEAMLRMAEEEDETVVFDDLLDKSYELMMENINTLGGIYIISNVYPFMTEEQKDEMFDALDSAAFDDPKVVNFLQLLREYRQNAPAE